MQKIDTTNWQPFKVGDLFRIKSGKGITKFEISTHGGSLPAIQSGEANFGCIGFIDKDYCISKGYVFSEGECLTVARSGSSGYVGYQASQCVVGDSAKILEPKFEASTLRLLFLRAILMVNKKKYAYIDKVTNENYVRDIILLPAIDKNTPNWQFMEDYMRGIEQRAERALINLNCDKKEVAKCINTKYWQRFKLKDLFQIMLSKGDIQAKKMKDGDIPLISSGKFNNGVCKHIAEGDGKAEMFEANTITVDMFGKSYFQPLSYYAVSHGRVNILRPLFKINNWIALYIVSILDASFSQRYSFTGMCNQEMLMSEQLSLPATPDGEPDWQYMEMYMRGVEAIAKNKIDALQQSKKSTSPTPQTPFTNYGTVNIIDNSRNYNIK